MVNSRQESKETLYFDGLFKSSLPFSLFSSWSPGTGITSSCSSIVASWFDENSKKNETGGYSGIF